MLAQGIMMLKLDIATDDGARSKKRRAVRFNSLRQQCGPFAVGMHKRAPVERCPCEHSQRDFVSRLVRVYGRVRSNR